MTRPGSTGEGYRTRVDLTDGLIFDVVRLRASSISGWP